jgi:lipopolysaccharide/colanic/teichoic acid biosynthesis glycosyltransferase
MTRIVQQRAHHPRMSFRENHTYRRFRRVFDVAVASIALALAGPVLLLAAMAIRLEDGGPILFRQKRVGRYGKLFTIYKLRTMRSAVCADALKPAAGSDARITRCGRILRKASIDELPQLFNVLRGEMAIVGPRPEMPFIVREYEKWQHLRHLTKPGVTGLWQTTCRSTIPLHKPEATHIDLEYIRTASMATDGRIVLRTFQALVSTQGAY